MDEYQKKIIQSFEWKILRNCAKERKSLFKDRIDSIIRFTVWSDKFASFSFLIKKNGEGVFRISDPKLRLVKSLNNEGNTFFEKKFNLNNNIEEKVQNLEDNFQKLNKENYNRLGESRNLLIEFKDKKKYLQIDLLDINSYNPRDYLKLIIDFYNSVFITHLNDIPKYIRILNSTLSDIPPEKLHEYLDGERDSLIAFLGSFLPSNNILEFINGFPEERKINIFKLVSDIDTNDDDKYFIFREVERVLEKKYLLDK